MSRRVMHQCSNARSCGVGVSAVLNFDYSVCDDYSECNNGVLYMLCLHLFPEMYAFLSDHPATFQVLKVLASKSPWSWSSAGWSYK